MSRPNQFVNTFYLAVHLALNILVVALIVNLIEIYVPVKHLLMRYHLNLQYIYANTYLQKSLPAAVAIGIFVWYYQRKKSGSGNHAEKH